MRKVQDRTAFINACKAPVKVARARAVFGKGASDYVLPEQYREVEYIESTGTQYIYDSSLELSDKHSVEIKFSITDSDTNSPCLWCSRSDATTNQHASFVYKDNTRIRGDYGRQYTYDLTEPVVDGKTHIVRSEGLDFSLDNVSLGTRASTTFQSTTGTSFFAANTSGSGFGNKIVGKIYYITVKINNYLVRNLIPCVRLSDNKAGLYDTIGKVFYGSAVSTGFIAGQEAVKVLTSDDDIISWKLNQDSYFFNAVSTQATLTLLKTDWGDLVGEKVRLYFSVQTNASNDTWQEVSCGVYKIVKQEANVESEKTTLTLKDAIGLAGDQKYSDYGAMPFPMTVSELADVMAYRNNMTAETQRKNLVKYSDSFRTGSVPSGGGITPTVLSTGELQVAVQSGNGNWHANWWDSRNLWGDVESQFNQFDRFTIVLTIKKSSASDTGKPNFYIKSGMGYYALQGTVGTEYSELHYTGTWNKLNNIILHLGWANCVGTFTIKNFMIKKGDYTPYEPYVVLPNTDYTIQEDLWKTINETTGRDVLSQIAGATGSLARANSDGKTIDYVSTMVPSDTLELTYGEMKKWKIGEKYGDVNTVVLSRQPEEDNVAVQDDDMVNGVGGKNFINSGIPPVSSSYRTTIEPTTNGVIVNRKNTSQTGAGYAIIPIQSVEKILGKTVAFSFGVSGDRAREVMTLYGYKNGTVSNTRIRGFSATSGSFTMPNSIPSGEDGYCLCFYVETGENKSATFTNIQLELGSTPTPYEPFVEAGNIAVKLGNNEILDDDRESLATPILNSVKGLGFYGGEITTTGIGLLEVGDYVYVNDGTDTYKVLVTAVDLTVDGSIKETIKCVPPVEEDTNYAIAGSVYKSIWNTEIKVDKQGNQIASIVERADTFEGQTQQNFTRIDQSLTEIVSSVQTAGGTNLIKNSVGFNKDNNGNFADWTKTGTVTSQTSADSLNYGAVSGNQFDMSASSSLTQRVNVAVVEGRLYTLSAYISKSVTGTVTISLTNATDNYQIVLNDQTAYGWTKVALEALQPHGGYFDVTITVGAGTSFFHITDLMLSASDRIVPWQQASSEILNTQVALTDQGVKVKSSTSNDYVQITPLEFAGYSDAGGSMEKVFYLAKNTTKITKLKARDQIMMPPIKIIPITSGNRAGWAFVKTDETWSQDQ